MKSLWTAFNYLGLFVGLFFSLWVLSRRRITPGVTWAWIMSFFLLPFLGPFGYLLVGYSNFKRRKRPRPEPQKKLPEAGFVMRSIRGEIPASFAPTAHLVENLTGFPPMAGNKIRFFEGQESIYQALTQAILEAQQTIYLEYYIFRSDSVGIHFRDLLIKKAKEGLKVKLLVDHVGSFSLNKRFILPLQQAGVEFAFFGSLTIKRPWGFQLRNHRKLAVIDGAIAFMGSQNICSDYKLWRLRKLDWVDNQFHIQGPGVAQLESVFLEDWDFTTGQKIPSTPLKPDPLFPGTSILQLLPTGPDEHEHALEAILMALIHSAQERITLLTPYFVPTESIAISLESAARRGVKVDILLPRKSDHWLVDAASKSWYWELLKNGISIYETPAAFLHNKQVTVDSRVTLIGSANMDERSFRLNFECSALIYDSEMGQVLQDAFNQRLAQATAVQLHSFESLNLLARIRNGLFKLISPLL